MTMYEQSLRHFLKPVHAYLDDPTVSEIMINGPEEIWIERKGRLTKTDAKFTPEALEAAARNMAQFVGRLLNDENPRLDARLPDGSRIHVVMPPIARKGCTIAIRKFFPDKLTVENLVEFGSMSPAMARFIEACVALKENMVVSGGTGSGKTTLLNCVASYIPDDERILTIEDSAELQLNQEHLVPFESRPPDKFGKGKVDMGDLLHSALRLRPDRIVVGEVRGGEAFHLMQAMNTGHGGSLCTVHANTPTDTLRRLESLCLQSGIDLPMIAVRAQVASAINIIICCARLQDGSRKTTHISEVLPLNDKGDYRTQDIFVFTQTHKDADGKIHGYHAPTGLLPTFLDKLKAYGFDDIDETFFDPRAHGLEPPPVYTASGDFKQRWAPSLRHREEGIPDEQAGPPPEVPKVKVKMRRAPGAAKKSEEAPKAKAPAAPARTRSRVATEPEAPPPPPPADRTDDVDLAAALLEDELADDEGTDPGLEPSTEMAPIPAEDGKTRVAPLPTPNVEVALEDGDPTASVVLPDDAGADDEEAAIAAALAAAEAGAPDEVQDEPSIQLAEDFQAEAEQFEEERAPTAPRPRVQVRPDASGVRPRGRRRKRGGVVGGGKK
ncbi:MAG: CpaF family protein [Deltaproteobacteria bacterium]|nr:MAG: CpaF family protein [Deltaproteobacteria bacterium]